MIHKNPEKAILSDARTAVHSSGTAIILQGIAGSAPEAYIHLAYPKR